MADRRRASPTITLVALALVVQPGACAKLKLKSSKSRAVPSAATTIASAPIATADAGPDPSVVAAAARAAAEAEARAAAIVRATELVADIRWMVKKGVTVNPAKAGEGDVASKCDAIDGMRSGAVKDAELDKVLDDGSALCTFDVPLLTASESLDHLRGTPSQASRLLMCTVATREIAKARAVHPNDARVRREEGRRATLCK